MKVRKLQGRTLSVEKTGEFIEKDGEKWEKCIFTIDVSRFSKRTPEEVVPSKLKGKNVKLVRYCCFDWHYKTGYMKTFEPDETEALLKGEKTNTVYW